MVVVGGGEGENDREEDAGVTEQNGIRMHRGRFAQAKEETESQN